MAPVSKAPAAKVSSRAPAKAPASKSAPRDRPAERESSGSECYVYDAVRTPRGKGRLKDGALAEATPIHLATTVLAALPARGRFDERAHRRRHPRLRRAGRRARRQHRPAWPRSRPATTESVPGLQINRYCASGLEAVNIAAAKIKAGHADIVVAGGVESMSRVPMGTAGGAWASDPSVAFPTFFVPQGSARISSPPSTAMGVKTSTPSPSKASGARPRPGKRGISKIQSCP